MVELVNKKINEFGADMMEDNGGSDDNYRDKLLMESDSEINTVSETDDTTETESE